MLACLPSGAGHLKMAMIRVLRQFYTASCCLSDDGLRSGSAQGLFASIIRWPALSLLQQQPKSRFSFDRE